MQAKSEDSWSPLPHALGDHPRRTAAVAALAIGFSPSVMALKKALATAETVMRNNIDQSSINGESLRLFVTQSPFDATTGLCYILQIATKVSSFLRHGAAIHSSSLGGTRLWEY